MTECVKCGVAMGKFEVFLTKTGTTVCRECFAVEFEKEFQSALKVARLKQ